MSPLGTHRRLRLADLDAETLRRIREAREDGLTFKEVAGRFGLSEASIRAVLKPQEARQ